MFCESEYSERLLIIQCDSGHEYGNLIACTRYRIDDMREKAREKTDYNGSVTHVIMIVHLPRGVETDNKDAFSFIGYQGGTWISAHIDDIHVTSDNELTLTNAMNTPISQLFYNKSFKQPDETYPKHAFDRYNDLKSKLKEVSVNRTETETIRIIIIIL